MFLEVSKEVVVRGDQIRWASSVSQNFEARLDVWSPVAASVYRVMKCSTMPWRLHPFATKQSTNKIPSLFQKTDTNILYDFCVLEFSGLGEPPSPFLGLFLSLVVYTIQVSPIDTRWLKYPTGSSRNRSKIACEACIWSLFWQHWDVWEPHLAESFLLFKIARKYILLFFGISPGSMLSL
jgi:hypothetical protein